MPNNNVFMSTKQLRRDDKSGLGAMSAYVIREDAIEPAHEVAVRIKKVNLVAANVGREGTVSYSYSAFESNLQKHLVSDTKLSAGIPKLFKADAAFGYASAGAAREQTVEIHFAATEWVAQGRIKIREDDITLDDSFVQKIKAVCESKAAPAKKANDLMNVLDNYGHFVPTDIIVGGRITLTEDTKLTDWSTFESVKTKFDAAAQARFRVKGVPVQVGGGAGVLHWTTNNTSVQDQAKAMKLSLTGGDPLLGRGNPTALGDGWLDSVGPYENWRTFGFGKHSLVPIIDFLPKDTKLKEQCYALLLEAFRANLVVKKTGAFGHKALTSNKDKPFTETELKYTKGGRPIDRGLTKNSKGLAKIVVTSQGHVDGLKLTYRLYNGPGQANSLGKPATYTWDEVSGAYGRKDREKQYDSEITFREGETIKALELWVDEKKDGGTLRRMAIRSNTGVRYPDDKDFYGTNHSPGDKLYVVEVPRARALLGYTGDFVHALGLEYLDIAESGNRPYLIAMEPFLYPTGDFGPLL